VRRALSAVFGGAVGKDTVSRVWRKVKGDWDAWNARSLGGEPIVRLILDGTVVRVRLDRRATSIVLLVNSSARAAILSCCLSAHMKSKMLLYSSAARCTTSRISDFLLYTLSR
jgi:transposase-like protein